MTVKVLFVCLGNICRSPTAHGLFQDKVNQSGLEKAIHVDSAGTGDWHVGHAPDRRAQDTALDRGYNISHLRARAVAAADFTEFDYILGMDRDNVRNLQALCPSDYRGTLGLFLEVAGVGHGVDVPDPYYGGQQHFDQVIQLVEAGATGLLELIQRQHEL